MPARRTTGVLPREVTRFRFACITAWNMDAFDLDWPQRMHDKGLSYVVIGRETCPRTGRRHLQCYFEAPNPKTVSQWQDVVMDKPRAHVECRASWKPEGEEIAENKGDRAADYCKKDGDFIEYGTLAPGQGARMDLADCKTMIDEGKQMIDLYEKHFGTCVRCYRGLMNYKDLVDRKRRKEAEPEPKEVVVYVGASGSGKSHHCWHDPDYRRSGYKYPLLAENKVWFDGYEGEEVLWVDEFRGSVFPFGLFLQVTDKWGARVEVKGGSVETFFKKILISTTVPPGDWYKCSNFLKNPKQLWRRLTQVYWLGPVEHDEEGFAIYPEPELIPDPEHDTRTNPYYDGVALHYPRE